MNGLKIIKGNNNKEDKIEAKRAKMFKLYANALTKEFEKNHWNLDGKPKNINKIITYGVKEIFYFPRENLTPETYRFQFFLMDTINSYIGQLTPQELINLFPIEKKYDGAKWEMKDYFYTKKFMDSLPQDKPIKSDSILEILWEYMNKELRKYTVKYTSVLDKIAIMDGEKGAWEQFIEDAGIDTYTMYKDDKGKEYAVNDTTGEIRKIHTRSSNLKILKGGK